MYLTNIIDINHVVVADDTRRIISNMRQTWVDRAKRRMKILGKTQEDLKAALGVKTRGAVGHYFTGRNDLSTEQVVALASALELSVEELLTGKRVDGAQGISDIPEHILQLARSITDAPPDKAKVIQMIADAPKEKIHAILVLLGDQNLDPPQREESPAERHERKIRVSPHVIIKDPKGPRNQITRKRKESAGGNNHGG